MFWFCLFVCGFVFFLIFASLLKTRISSWFQFTTWKQKPLCWHEDMSMEGSIHISVNINERLNLGGVEALVDVRSISRCKMFHGERFVLKNWGLEKEVTAMRNYSVRTNEAKAKYKFISFPKHLDDYQEVLKILRCCYLYCDHFVLTLSWSFWVHYFNFFLATISTGQYCFIKMKGKVHA